MAALAQAKQLIPQPQKIFALIDTGASCTCVDPTVLKALKLSPTGQASVNTPSTGTQPHSADQYDVSLIIPGSSSTQPPFYLHTLAVIESQLMAAQGIHALIGRDVLQSVYLTYNGAMSIFTFAY